MSNCFAAYKLIDFNVNTNCYFRLLEHNVLDTDLLFLIHHSRRKNLTEAFCEGSKGRFVLF